MEMARILRTARSGRAVRFPAIMRSGENCASCESVIKSWTEKDCITCILCGSKRGRKKILNTEFTEGRDAEHTAKSKDKLGAQYGARVPPKSRRNISAR